MPSGKIKKKCEKGFGFIAEDGKDKKEIFFHATSLSGIKFDELNEGDKVEFAIGQGPKGPRAENIRLVT